MIIVYIYSKHRAGVSTAWKCFQFCHLQRKCKSSVCSKAGDRGGVVVFTPFQIKTDKPMHHAREGRFPCSAF